MQNLTLHNHIRHSSFEKKKPLVSQQLLLSSAPFLLHGQLQLFQVTSQIESRNLNSSLISSRIRSNVTHSQEFTALVRAFLCDSHSIIMNKLPEIVCPLLRLSMLICFGTEYFQNLEQMVVLEREI